MLIVYQHGALLAVLMVAAVGTLGRANELDDLRKATYHSLNQIRENKRAQLASYVKRMSCLPSLSSP